MSDLGDLNIREQIVRIDRMRVESDKFQAEQRKLIAESEKFQTEQRKLLAESMKLDRDRWLSPVVVVVALLGAVGGIVAGVTAVLRLMGRLP